MNFIQPVKFREMEMVFYKIVVTIKSHFKVKIFVMDFLLKNINETNKLGQKIAAMASEGDVFCLKGQLGIGKTTLARLVAKSLTWKTHQCDGRDAS